MQHVADENLVMEHHHDRKAAMYKNSPTGNAFDYNTNKNPTQEYINVMVNSLKTYKRPSVFS